MKIKSEHLKQAGLCRSSAVEFECRFPNGVEFNDAGIALIAKKTDLSDLIYFIDTPLASAPAAKLEDRIHKQLENNPPRKLEEEKEKLEERRAKLDREAQMDECEHENRVSRCRLAFQTNEMGNLAKIVRQDDIGEYIRDMSHEFSLYMAELIKLKDERRKKTWEFNEKHDRIKRMIRKVDTKIENYVIREAGKEVRKQIVPLLKKAIERTMREKNITLEP